MSVLEKASCEPENPKARVILFLSSSMALKGLDKESQREKLNFKINDTRTQHFITENNRKQRIMIILYLTLSDFLNNIQSTIKTIEISKFLKPSLFLFLVHVSLVHIQTTVNSVIRTFPSSIHLNEKRKG
jgi:hypothetical protein